jgi:hypothetical protein
MRRGTTQEKTTKLKISSAAVPGIAIRTINIDGRVSGETKKISIY